MPLKFCYLISFSYWDFLKLLITITTKVTNCCLGSTAGKIMEGWYKLHKFFCPWWAGGGRTLICLSTIQLVEPFAGFLVWAVIFLVVLNLIFIVLILQACFSTCLPSVSANQDRPLFVCTWLSFASLFVVKNYIRCFWNKACQAWKFEISISHCRILLSALYKVH